MAESTVRDAKLIQYLNEAYGKEKELETSLEAHIAMTTRAPYKKRLQQHLRETKAHSRELEKRIRHRDTPPAPRDRPGPCPAGPLRSAARGRTRPRGRTGS